MRYNQLLFEVQPVDVGFESCVGDGEADGGTVTLFAASAVFAMSVSTFA
jgi:hypothetical protein